MTDRRRLPSPDEAVARLVRLARDAPEQGLAPGEWAGLRRLERALLQGSRRRRMPVRALLALAVAGIAAAVVVAALRRDQTLTFEVRNASVNDGGYVSAGAADASVRFSDRSEFGVGAGTRLRVSHVDVHGARVMLEGGLLHVRIRPQPRASWAVAAGPYVVHVTGTEFDVGWRVQEQTLDLLLFRGSVVVDGPLANGGLRMAPGQHLVANASNGSLSITTGDVVPAPVTSDIVPASPAPSPPASTATAPTKTSSPSRAVEPPPPPPASRGPAVVASVHSPEQPWAARVARGDFAAVVDDAERRGLERSLAEASPVDLTALADAARYARRPDLARRALLTARARYGATVQARDAAFFLGGLMESEKNDAGAVEWYDVYLRESPDGAYVSQSLGRKMILLEKIRNPEGARKAAAEYLDRFAGGPYAQAARRLLQAP